MKVREMELLVRVAETGSMTLAARQLHLTPAAVSAAVQRVEQAIGVRIFERTTRALHPTDEGLVVLEGCLDVVDRWQRALEGARGQRTELEGVVHLSAPADTTYQLVQPVVADLCEEHPKLRIVMHTGDAIRHLHRDAIDMAVRYGALTDSTLTARKLAEPPRILVAAPSYLAERGAPESPEALSEHVCLTLHLSNAPTVSWELSHRENPRSRVHLDIASPLCGDGYLVRRWAVAGRGIAFKSLFDVVDDLEAGRLVHVLKDYWGGRIAIHALFPSRRFLAARVRAVDTALAARFGALVERCRDWMGGVG